MSHHIIPASHDRGGCSISVATQTSMLTPTRIEVWGPNGGLRGSVRLTRDETERLRDALTTILRAQP